MPHENRGCHGTVSWKHIVSGTFVYIGKKRVTEIDSTGFTTIIHQVRHPLKVIASMQTFSDSTWHYMAEFIELDLKRPPVVRAMQAWTGWNALIESKADWRFQIEQIKECFPELCRHVGLTTREFPEIPFAVRDSRTERYEPLELRDLITADPGLSEQIETLAERYGYDDLASFAIPVRPVRRGRLLRKFFGG